EGCYILLAHAPDPRGATVDLARVAHRELRSCVLNDQPLHSIHIGLVEAEEVRVTPEHRLHIRLVPLQAEGAGTNAWHRLLQAAVLFYHLAGDDPHTRRVG